MILLILAYKDFQYVFAIMNGNVVPQKPFNFLLNSGIQKESETKDKVETVN